VSIVYVEYFNVYFLYTDNAHFLISRRSCFEVFKISLKYTFKVAPRQQLF